MEIKKTLAHIRQFHKNLSKLTGEKEKKSTEYLDDFVDEISRLIEGLEVFSHHIIWECVYDHVPEQLDVEEKYILRDATPKQHRNAPILRNDEFNYPKDSYFVPTLNKKDFGESFRDYFDKEPRDEVFDIPLKPGFSYINLPVFSEDEDLPQWVLTLIYREEDSEAVHDEDSQEIMEHLSHQIGLAWDKFLSNSAELLLEKIDVRMAGREKTRSVSTHHRLKEIALILSAEMQVDWCAFFLIDEGDKNMRLETGNVESGYPAVYSLTGRAGVIANRLKENEIFRLSGREALEGIIGAEKLKPIEKAIRQEEKRRKVEQGIHRATPYLLFEHTLFYPISVAVERIGLMTLFRAKKTQKPGAGNSVEGNYVTRPFSEFETYLTGKVQRHLFDIIISQDAAQQRLRGVIAQVSSPVHALISSTGQSKKDKTAGAAGSLRNLSGKLDKANALARVAEQYVRNFQVLLDIDTRSLRIKKETIPDLRGYLIERAGLHTPVFRHKCISVNITRQTANHIAVDVDKELFNLAIFNIIDNALKYSFDPEERAGLGLQHKPASTDDKENVQVTAVEEKDFVTITISNYGIEIPKHERKRIFDRDFRGIQAPDRAKGTGIGLFIPKEIIAKHGGTIELVKGTEKYNTVFKIRLPKGQPMQGGDKK